MRIGDDEFALFGAHYYRFAFSGGQYSIRVDQSDQNYLTVEYQGATEYWPIQWKEKKGKKFRLSGQADRVPEIIDDLYWYELVLDAEPTITYWGDRVVYRTDHSPD